MNILRGLVLLLPALCFAETSLAHGGGERGGGGGGARGDEMHHNDQMQHNGNFNRNDQMHQNDNNFRRNENQVNDVNVNPVYVAPGTIPYYQNNNNPTIQDLEELKGIRE